jgi:hypothetical protein
MIYLVKGATAWEFQVWRLGVRLTYPRFWRSQLNRHWLTGLRNSPLTFQYFGKQFDGE